MLARRGVTRIEDLTGADADEIIGKLSAKVSSIAATSPESFVGPSVADPAFAAKVAEATQLPGITKTKVNGPPVDYSVPESVTVNPASQHGNANGIGATTDPSDDFLMADATRPDRNGNAAQVVTQ
jgi:hypothetical protein